MANDEFDYKPDQGLEWLSKFLENAPTDDSVETGYVVDHEFSVMLPNSSLVEHPQSETQVNQGQALGQTQVHDHSMASELQQPAHAGYACSDYNAFKLNSHDGDRGLPIPATDNLDGESHRMICTHPDLPSRVLDPSLNHPFTVGQQFPDVESCRKTIRGAASARHFKLTTLKSGKTRFTVKCAGEGCSWRIHAAKLAGRCSFEIKTCCNQHTCAGITHLGDQQASLQRVADSERQRLMKNPICEPEEIRSTELRGSRKHAAEREGL